MIKRAEPRATINQQQQQPSGHEQAHATTRSNLSSQSKTANRRQPHAKLQVKFSLDTLFLNACADGDLDECRRLLEDQHVDINVSTSDGLTGLHQAAICGNQDLVRFLLDRGANINCCDYEGWTPLHVAARMGREDICKMLLERQADATKLNCDNLLAIDLARLDSVRQLIKQYLNAQGHVNNDAEAAEQALGAPVDPLASLHSQEEVAIARDVDRWLASGRYEDRSHPITKATALHVMAAKGYLKPLRRLLESGELRPQLDLEARDHEGFTPLLAASFWSQSEVVELLIKHGANVHAKSNYGYEINHSLVGDQQKRHLAAPRAQRAHHSPIRVVKQTTFDGGSQVAVEQRTRPPRLGDKREESVSIEKLAASVPAVDSVSKNMRDLGGYLLRSQSAEPPAAPSATAEASSDPATQEPSSSSTIMFGSISTERLLTRSSSMSERELRKTFKELLVEFETLKRQLKSCDEKEKKQQMDWIRKERSYERKISELEEEKRQLEQYKQDIAKIKEENRSLVRVVSRLTSHSSTSRDASDVE